jgi:hypothetical protein
MMGDMATETAEAPGQLVHKPVVHPALTTPCTVTALRNWLEQGVIAVTSGDHWEAQITTTTTSISVA